MNTGNAGGAAAHASIDSVGLVVTAVWQMIVPLGIFAGALIGAVFVAALLVGLTFGPFFALKSQRRARALPDPRQMPDRNPSDRLGEW